MMYLKYPANNLTYIYSQSTPYAGALDAWIEGKVEEYRDSIENIEYAMFVCQNFNKVVLPCCSAIGIQAFWGCTNLQEIYLLSNSVCTLASKNAFTRTPMSSSAYTGTFGSIYVPASLVETYKAAENWSDYADRIAAYGGDSQ